MVVRRALAGCLLLASASAHAVAPRSLPRLVADTLTALPASGVTKPLRIARHVLWSQVSPPAAWTHFVQATGGSWEAAWDGATGVPTQIWGAGIAAPGTMADPAVAERFARQLLAAHVGLLAPGSAATDFELAANVSDGDIRSVGFFQRAGGRRVVGGQVSFRFKRDRLVMIASQALPNVHVTVATARLATLGDQAATSLRAAVQLPTAPVVALGDDVILPLVADDTVLGFRLAAPYSIDGGADGHYVAYADPATGGVIAVRQLNEYATGTVLYHGVDRYPGRGRLDLPAPRTYVSIAGQQQTTTTAGGVTWSPDAQVTLQTAITGDLVTVVNKAPVAEVASAALVLDPGASIVWDASASTVAQSDGTLDHEDDAQVIAFLEIGIAKQYIRANIDPSMPTLDDQMLVNVNIAQDCNAFFDGKAVNFFHATKMCENTGRVADVMHHEYGHRLHTAEIIPGVGDFDGAMSEGAADFLACSIVGDSGMGRGFFYVDAPLRELDPPDFEWMWPQDIGEIHHEGQIFGGTFWDLRKALIAQLGDAAGIALVDKLYVAALRRAVDIPSSLIEVLVADDDDGNLSNGTPHECLIRDAFGRHGLRTASGTVEAPGFLDENALAIGIAIDVSGLSTRCSTDALAGATLKWTPPYTGVPTAGSVAAVVAGPDRFFAQLPLSPQETVYYSAKVGFQDGSTLMLPDNLADPDYELYTGHTVKLYCTTFEDGDPFAAGWTTGTADNSPSTWSWGTPSAGATNPHTAYSGTHILAQALDTNYLANSDTWVKTPAIDVFPYSDVRVQYRRWLGVEDSHYDQARVTANDERAWINYTQNKGGSSAIAHLDKEWRFHDVPLSSHFSGRMLTVGWDLKSDPGVEYAGWNLDDVCIVANPYAICGDGIQTPTEQCDNGAANADLPDKCRTDCRAPTCGDFIVDSSEQCDDGPAGSPTCTKMCTLIDVGTGGCCGAGGGGRGSLVLGGLVGLVVLRRRRAGRLIRS